MCILLEVRAEQMQVNLFASTGILHLTKSKCLKGLFISVARHVKFPDSTVNRNRVRKPSTLARKLS